MSNKYKMLSKLILTITLLIFSYQINAQSIINKTYEVSTGASCKSMLDGGCMIYTYRVLQFEKDSVVVSYRVVASCVPKEREKAYENMQGNFQESYPWTIKNNVINIDGFNEYEKLTFIENSLNGLDTYQKEIVFNEVILTK